MGKTDAFYPRHLAAAGKPCYRLALTARLIVRLLLAALFLFAGTVHLVDPGLFLPIMPPTVPFPLLCIEVSGVFELLGGAGLLVPNRRIEVLTGWGLTLLLVAVFPANIYMAAAHIRVHGIPAQPWITWARLPLQSLLILAVVWVTRIWAARRNP
jgi:uncharacterized membrane protein